MIQKHVGGQDVLLRLTHFDECPGRDGTNLMPRLNFYSAMIKSLTARHGGTSLQV
jgi:hypothetical protein